MLLSMTMMILLLSSLVFGSAEEGVAVPFNGKTTLSAAFEGPYYSAVVKDDNTLWMWGDNNTRQLGIDNRFEYETPVKSMENVESVNISGGRTTFVKKDHTLWTFDTKNAEPIKLMDNVQSVTSSSYSTAVVKRDGTLWMWGRATRGQLGTGELTTTLSEPTKIMDGVASVSMSWGHTAVVKRDGTLWTCGAADYGRLGDGSSTQQQDRAVFKQVMDHVIKVAVGYNNTAVIKDDGSLWVFGSNDLAKLSMTYSGYGDQILRPTKILDGVKDVSLGNSASAYVLNNGDLLLCGSFNGTSYYGSKVVMNNVEEVSFGYNHILALQNDGSVWAWGENSRGQIGNGTTQTQAEPFYVLENVNPSSSLVGFDIPLEDLKITSASLSLGNNLIMNFKVPRKVLVGFDNIYLEVLRNGKTKKLTYFREQGNDCVFSYENIAPQTMGDVATATLYAEKDGDLYASKSVSLSIKEYAYGMLDMYSSDENAKLRTLMVDLLNYGSSAQTYHNYKSDDLVNADLTEEQKAWGSSDVATWNNIIDTRFEIVPEPYVTWKSASLILDDAVTVRFKFSADEIGGFVIKVRYGPYEDSIDPSRMFENGDGTYSFQFKGLYAHQMSEPLYVTVYKDNLAVSNTLRYSVESYAAQVAATTPDSPLRMLTDSMMRYGMSAANYA